jgi:curved DNA-binding protein CbpA
MKNHYQILGVQPSASAQELKLAHRDLVLKLHPDRLPEAERPAATQKLKAVNEAYSVLSDERQRRRYDSEISVSSQQSDEIVDMLFDLITPKKRRNSKKGPKPRPCDPCGGVAGFDYDVIPPGFGADGMDFLR